MYDSSYQMANNYWMDDGSQGAWYDNSAQQPQQQQDMSWQQFDYSQPQAQQEQQRK